MTSPPRIHDLLVVAVAVFVVVGLATWAKAYISLRRHVNRKGRLDNDTTRRYERSTLMASLLAAIAGGLLAPLVPGPGVEVSVGTITILSLVFAAVGFAVTQISCRGFVTSMRRRENFLGIQVSDNDTDDEDDVSGNEN